MLRTKKSKSINCLFTFHFNILCHISFQPHFCHHDIHQTKTSNWLPIHPHSHPHHQPQSCHLDLHSCPIIFFCNTISTPPPTIRPSRQLPSHFLSSLSIPKEIIHSHPTQLVQHPVCIPDKSHVQLFNPLQTQQVIQPASNYFTYNPVTTEQQITHTDSCPISSFFYLLKKKKGPCRP